jgi:uncharacterized protein YggE
MKSAPRFVIALLAFVIFLPACSEKKESVRSRVLVLGEADSKVPPDTAVVVLSVVTQSGRALDAQQQNARKSEAVIQAIKQAAGPNPEVKTSDYNLEPQENWNGNTSKIVGYEARNTVTVNLSALDNVGAVVDAATGAGANSVEGVRFILREADAARGQALADASKQAMEKAKAMAQALGGRITRVVEEREGGFPERAAPPDDISANGTATNSNLDYRAKQAARTPVEAGPLNVRSQVFLTVEIEAQR